MNSLMLMRSLVVGPNSKRIASFRNIINNAGLLDLGYNGPAYTWTNRRLLLSLLFKD